MNMTEARKLKLEPQLDLVLIDMVYSHELLKDQLHDQNIELKCTKSTLRKVERRLNRAKEKYKEIYGKEWKDPR